MDLQVLKKILYYIYIVIIIFHIIISSLVAIFIIEQWATE